MNFYFYKLCCAPTYARAWMVINRLLHADLRSGLAGIRSGFGNGILQMIGHTHTHTHTHTSFIYYFSWVTFYFCMYGRTHTRAHTHSSYILIYANKFLFLYARARKVIIDPSVRSDLRHGLAWGLSGLCNAILQRKHTRALSICLCIYVYVCTILFLYIWTSSNIYARTWNIIDLHGKVDLRIGHLVFQPCGLSTGILQMNPHTQLYIHIYIYTYINIYIYIYIHACMYFCNF